MPILPLQCAMEKGFSAAPSGRTRFLVSAMSFSIIQEASSGLTQPNLEKW